MANKIKYTQKELKQPDTFRAFILNLAIKASDNFNKILYAFGAVILIIVAVYMFTRNQSLQRETAGILFKQAVANYKGGKVDDALSGLADLISEYPNQPTSSLAFYYSGVIHYESGNYEKSIGEMKQYLATQSRNKLLEDSANLRVGLSYYNIGKWEEAVVFFKKLHNSGSPYEKQATVNLGLSYDKLGQHEKAQDIYTEVLSYYLKPPLRQPQWEIENFEN